MKVALTISVENVVKTSMSDTTYFNILEKFMRKLTHLYVLIAIRHILRKAIEIDMLGPAKKILTEKRLNQKKLNKMYIYNDYMYNLYALQLN